ncbi:ATPase ASNA1 homolog [Schistocerca gregaria]|uniref:ATPase ASNA1 homolog n=1 Tax=Schistocerca gregaria TaxID=7010 RepID=UPI00211E2149|nr:ATPase ASNA1 homolog [Schistocerca gregaria]
MDALLQEVAEELDVLPSTIQNILDKKSLKWVFIGGKGGVGKTTCSSTIAVLLSRVRESVLIISTDPAHNLSDAFGQQFTGKPTLVKGFENLFAMEIDPTFEEDTVPDVLKQDSSMLNTLKDLILSLPGIDEAMSFAEVMRQVQKLQFDVVVFDTAPTGHTLRLLSFPATMDKALSQMANMKHKFSNVFNQFSSMFRGNQNAEQMEEKLESTRHIIEEVHKQFKNSDLTTFVCVCIPEFLSLYETERLVQELIKFEMDVCNIIINQVLFSEKETGCKLCEARTKMQAKYINQIEALYQDFHVIKLPLLKGEIRGVNGEYGLINFGNYMLHPYEDEWNLKNNVVEQ